MASLPSGGTEIIEHAIVALSETSLAQLRSGELTRFTFNFSNSRNISLVVTDVGEKSNYWYFTATPENKVPGVLAFTIMADGTFGGSFAMPGAGMFNVVSTGTPPYHLVYLADGILDYD